MELRGATRSLLQRGVVASINVAEVRHAVVGRGWGINVHFVTLRPSASRPRIGAVGTLVSHGVVVESATKEAMKKLLLVSVLAFVSSGAFAQSSQSQGSAQADTNGNVATTLERSSEAKRSADRTVGMSSGARSSGPNGTANDRPTAKGDPARPTLAG